MEFKRSALILVALLALVTITAAKGFDLGQFAEDIFGDRAAAEDLKNPPKGHASDLSGGACKDFSTSCSKYRKHCAHSVVQRFCKVTCRLCTNKEINLKVISACADNPSSMCAQRKQLGMCQTYKAQMKQFCPKSCGFCGTVNDCSDQKDESYCKTIQRYGYCSKQDTRKLALQYCKKTCKLCAKDLKCGVVKVNGPTDNDVVIAGVDAKKGSWPWQVAIYHKDKFLCGGSLINEDTILSAAHCFRHRTKDLSLFKVVLGDHNRDYSEGTEQFRTVSRLEMHPGYRGTKDNDIALLKVSRKAVQTKFVVPVCLPPKDSKVAAGTQCYMTGWGKITHPGNSIPKLQQAKVPVASLSECMKVNNRRKTKVTDKMVCAGDRKTFKGGCHGDSGGPFVCKTGKGSWELRGIMSWGASDCNALEKYTVFTRVSRYIDWIRNYM